MDKHIIKLSVHQFVEYILDGGDLVFGSTSTKRMLEGIESHVYVQNRTEGRCEMPVSYTQLTDMAALDISGRIDILHEQGENITVEELKSTYDDIDGINKPKHAHLLQAKCYAAMYLAKNEDVSEIEVRITYIAVRSKKQISLNESFKRGQLIAWLRSKCDEILYDAELELSHIKERNYSAQSLKFPYGEFREGQRNMAAYVYLTARDRGVSLICAPTGIGKTMGAIYPAVKAMGEGMADKVFYLTAKNTIKNIACESLKTLYNNGYYGRSVELGAKSTMCPYEHQVCHPMYCEKAAGYYNRLPEALENMMSCGHYGRGEIENVAQKHNICPFELSLDFSQKCDVIVCDYNHAFDPVAHLKRFFDDGGDYLLLADEAHNLVDRARDMFSAQISKKAVLTLRRSLPKKPDKIEKKIRSSLNKLNSVLLDYKKQIEYDGQNSLQFFQPPDDIENAMSEFISAAEPMMDVSIRKSYSNELFDLYFACKRYLSVSGDFDVHFRCFAENKNKDTNIKLMCLDPSQKLQQTYSKVGGAVLFSASLVPFSYFSRLLCDTQSENYLISSPFSEENLKVIINDKISTKYADRKATADAVCENIHEFVSNLNGNHMIFFPSYKYMEMIYLRYCQMYNDTEIAVQYKNMHESERQGFLNLFEVEYDRPFAAFAVMGGVFSEGIDLVGKRLIGAVIVGVGLPQICIERDLIKDYHFEYDEPGFAYAYAYPGFNKIIQAVGRIIRTKDDRGAALLLDGRFSHELYSVLMPSIWHPINYISKASELAEILAE